MKTIEITINAKGESQVETKGFSGEACRTASQLIESALGLKLRERLTDEFHRIAVASQVQQT
jgi:Protein of unknown function (DUF2997)